MQNTAVKASTMSGYRSAMRNYYKMQKVPLPSQFDGDIKDVFQGIRRITATSEQTTSVKDSGKRPLGYGAYDALCRTTILAMDAGFLHLFLVLSWNLMARSKSTETIQLGHLSYEEDAVGITFFKSKTDQDGSKRRDPRHIYANPLQPHTCAFLALGLYLACNPMLAAGALFPGSSQRTRFGKGLKLALIEDNPVGSSEIGTHSIRKGAATFVSSGSTGGPSLVSICLRCGWSLGSVFERYMHYERAGDQFVGRVVAGLPLNQANFAVLPPHFVDNNSDAVVAALDVTFPTLSKVASMRGILAHGMASLVRHFDYVVDTLPAKHIVFGTPIFRQPLMLEALKAELATTNQRLQPSGIPPYIEVYRLLEHQGSSIDAMPRRIVDQMRGILDERDVTHGTITSVLIKQTIVDALQVLGVGRHLDEPALRREDEQGQRVTFLYSWGGRMHKLPEGFEFPLADTATAWSLWWLGNDRLKYVPYNAIDSRDLGSKKQRRILSEWKLVMTELADRYMECCGCSLPASWNERKAAESFDVAVRGLHLLLSTTPLERQRRFGQLKVVTVARLIRQRRGAKTSRPYQKRKRSEAPGTT
ncbi:hypothetical protein AaE_005148 [Aphanomyces astaci]|uniref:Core-binding (CB) domain-containing protein n=1 Tax=Aphanomyces astaci TaxID=112090 RepID=A0A6A5A8N5_APHAT|nr:hypothetical protein AaE_005148 [Aphanomyces astaci]